MQRLFSTFANGWPGVGILLQRGLAGSILLYYGVLQVSKPLEAAMMPEIFGAIAGLFLLVGLWTPIAGIAALVIELWAFGARAHESLPSLISGTLGATIAMIGPGAWSIDARLFGRKHIETRVTPKKS